MKNKEAIILAGGFGTRLRHIINNSPKPMAAINKQPFLQYLLDYAIRQNIDHVVLSVGHQSEIIKNHFGSQYKNLKISYCTENEPLGTGGAIKLSLKKTKSEHIYILNGDTFFPVSLKNMYTLHKQCESKLTIALKEMTDFERYGTVRINTKKKITGFAEKKFRAKGLINGGIYLLDSAFFSKLSLPEKFSFEKLVLEKEYKINPFYGHISEKYFIDIGVPEDYYRAQEEMPGHL